MSEKMITQLFAHDERMLDFIENSALLKQMREEGKEEGRVEGEEIGILKNLRNNIRQIAMIRFNIDAMTYQTLAQQLQLMTSQHLLDTLLNSAVLANSFAEFQQVLDKTLQTSNDS